MNKNIIKQPQEIPKYLKSTERMSQKAIVN